jgi:hypothetical protein
MAAITNLGDLRGAVEDTLARNDLANLFPVAVQVFESKFNTSTRIAEMEVAAELTVVNGVAGLPSNFLELRNVQGQDSNISYYLSGNNLVFTSSSPGTVDVLYYAKLQPLVNDTDSNWLLITYPHLYLYGVMAELGIPLQDSSIVQLNTALYEKARAQLVDADMGRRWGGSSIYLSSYTP